MTNGLYADGVESVSLLEGMMRVELFCYAGREEGGSARRELVGRLVLPPAGFLKAYEAMGVLVRRLEEQGLVARRPGATPDGAAVVSEKGAGERDARGGLASASPNFE